MALHADPPVPGKSLPRASGKEACLSPFRKEVAPMQPQLHDIVEGIRPAETREFIRGVFEDLGRLLGYLDGLRPLTGAGGAADEAHFVFEVVRCEALAAAGALDYFCACLDAPTGLSE